MPAFAFDVLETVKPRTESARERFIASNTGAAIFVREKTTGLAMLAVLPGRIVLTLHGTIPSEHIVGVLRDGHVAECLGSDAFHALIDLSTYNAAVDWQDIQDIRDVMPKGASRTNRNAYVVRNKLYAMVAKITAAFFPQTECAAFTSEAEARTWLGWN